KAHQAYQSRLAALTRRKDELQAQLRSVEAELQAVGFGGSANPLPTAARIPAAAATPSKPRMPAKPSSRPAQRQKTVPTLPRLLPDLVGAASGPLTVKELTASVARAKFPTSSRNLSQLVKNKVGGLVKRGLLRRAAGQPGVVLGKAQPAKSASAV